MGQKVPKKVTVLSTGKAQEVPRGNRVRQSQTAGRDAVGDQGNGAFRLTGFAMKPIVKKEMKMADRHLRRAAVENLTGLARSTIYDLMAKGLFPRPVRLTGKAVAWPESKITDWLASRAGA